MPHYRWEITYNTPRHKSTQADTVRTRAANVFISWINKDLWKFNFSIAEYWAAWIWVSRLKSCNRMFCIAPRLAVSLPRSLGTRLMHVTRQKMNRLLVGGVSSFSIPRQCCVFRFSSCLSMSRSCKYQESENMIFIGQQDWCKHSI